MKVHVEGIVTEVDPSLADTVTVNDAVSGFYAYDIAIADSNPKAFIGENFAPEMFNSTGTAYIDLNRDTRVVSDHPVEAWTDIVSLQRSRKSTQLVPTR